MLIMRKCADYIILTGHGDFGEKDIIIIVHQVKVLCVVFVQKNLLLKPGEGS